METINRKAFYDKFELIHCTLPNVVVTVNDYRYGIHCQLKIAGFDFQGEFVQADISNHSAWGYYAYAAYYLSNDFQSLTQTEKYKDVNSVTMDSEWYLIGLNYYFTQKNKLMSGYKTQFNGNKNINEAEIQYQIFFN